MQSKEVSVIYFNKRVFNNLPLREFLKRELLKKEFQIAAEIFEDEFSLDILDENLSKDLVLFALKDEARLISRVLATKLNCKLVLKDKTLIPSKVKEYKNGSFLVEIKSKEIAVILIDKNFKVDSSILEANKKSNFLYFFEEKEEFERFIDEFSKNKKLNMWLEYPNIIKVLLTKEPLLESKIKKFNFKSIQKDSLIEALIEYLSKNSLKITFAESCTGGALANRFISYSGASNIIDGSFVTYSNEIKSSWLGVKKETLEQFGAVSKECVKEMAKGAREKLGSNIAIAVSGIAGPTGAVENKPVGTVYICVDFEGEQKIKRLNLAGDRVFIQTQSVNWAISLLIESLGENFFNFFSKIS